jgi:hypothetical protein
LEGKLFTVVVGSAYRDSSEHYYLVEGIDAQHACEFAKRIAEAHDSSALTVLQCMEGEVKFCPTLFDGPHASYVPTVIDLRMPKVPLERIDMAIKGKEWHGHITSDQPWADVRKLYSALSSADYHCMMVALGKQKSGSYKLSVKVPADKTCLWMEAYIRRTAETVFGSATKAHVAHLQINFTEEPLA